MYMIIAQKHVNSSQTSQCQRDLMLKIAHEPFPANVQWRIVNIDCRVGQHPSDPCEE